MKKILLPVLVVGSLSAGAQSIGPSTINATGGSAVVAGNTYEYSIGEMSLVNTASAGSVVVTHGVLQPTEADPGGINGFSFNNLLQVFPNPAENELFLQTSFEKSVTLGYQLYDVAGKLITAREVVFDNGNGKESVAISGLAAGQYTLKVFAQSGSQKYQGAYQIQKLK